MNRKVFDESLRFSLKNRVINASPKNTYSDVGQQVYNSLLKEEQL